MNLSSLSSFIENMPEAMLVIDSHGTIISINTKACSLLNLVSQDIIDHNLHEFVNSGVSELRESFRTWGRIRTPVPAKLSWKSLNDKDNPRLQCHAFLFKPADEQGLAWIAIRCAPGKSITLQFLHVNEELKRQSGILQQLLSSRSQAEFEREKAQVTLESIGDAVLTTDSNGLIEMINPVAEKLLGWSDEMARGRPVSSVMNIVHELTRQPVENPVHLCLQDKANVIMEKRTVLIARNGTEYAIEDSVSPVRRANGEMLGTVMVFRDVTGEQLMKHQLEYLTLHDNLTGLKNRYFFEQQLKVIISGMSRSREKYGLLYIDLDQFKIINDTAGHSVGDEILIESSQRLLKRARSNDIVARLGGDEFGVILYDVSVQKLKQIADDYVESMAGFKFDWLGVTYDLNCSIGAVLIDENITTPNEIMRQADVACYTAKKEGRNRIHLYRSRDDGYLSGLGEHSVINEIKSAVEKNQFELLFHPIIDIESQTVQMHEVLLRMKGAESGLLSPAKFIPIAERHGFMNLLDIWVVSHAIDVLESHMQKGITHRLSINLSGTSLVDKTLYEMIKSRISSMPELAACLVFEVTETSAISHVENANIFIQQLRGLGIKFALDDFGTGFSSFSYLKYLPADYIKIDGTFVRDILHDPVDSAMVRSINQIAQSLGKQTVAEFVENAEILALLKEIGVDMAQGYYFGKPSASLIQDIDLQSVSEFI